MPTRFSRLLAVVTIALSLAAMASAQSNKKTETPGVAGKWTMSVEAGPHGNMTMGLTLKQEGTHVTGTFAGPHGDMPVDGEFSEGALKLSTTGGNADLQITFEGRLKEDGSLSGYLSSQMGDMRWSAERVKGTR